MLRELLSDYLANYPIWDSLELLFVPQSLVLVGVLFGLLLARRSRRGRSGGGGDGGSGSGLGQDGPRGARLLAPIEVMARRSPALAELGRPSLAAALPLVPSAEASPVPFSGSATRP
jgi:hypothetical protein